MNRSNMRLTVAVLVKSDADGLAQTLQCVQPLASEILVIDTGSTDNTREVAQQFGARVVEHRWNNDFAAARNFGLAQAQGDWVLWLDAGETMAAADAVALRQRLQDGWDAAKAYMLVVQTAAAPGVIAAEQIARIRLMPKRDGLRFAGRVRESLFESLENLGMAVDGLPQRILRGPREHDPIRKRERALRNQQLAGMEIDEIGRLPQLVNCLADAAHTLGETESAIELYRECLTADQSTSSERLEAYYGLLSCLDAVSASPQTAAQAGSARQVQLSLCVAALEQFPLDAQLLCAMGGYLQGQGRIDLALRAYETAFQFGRINPLVWHLDEITAIAAVCWAKALVQKEPSQREQIEQALAVLQLAVKRDGHTPRLARAMIDIYIDQARREDALAQLEHLAIAAELRPALASAIRGACVASQKNWIGARAYLQSAYDAGCHDVICFRWLCATLMNLGQVEPAREAAEHWLAVHPTDVEPQQLLATLPAPALAKPAQRRHSRIDAVKKPGIQHPASGIEHLEPRVDGSRLAR